MNWRKLPEHDYFLLARSYHVAAKKLVRSLDLDPGLIPDFDLCPLLSLNRHAIELHLKDMVLGDGGNFLPARPDPLSVHKTRSLSWLAQFAVQIVTALRWEAEFQVKGINGLTEFKALIEEANTIDPPFQAFRCPAAARPEMLKSTVLEFTSRLDALVELLEQTSDGLAAEWDLRTNPTAPEAGWPDDGGFEPTIQ